MAATHGPARAAWRCGRRVTRRARQSPLKSSELLLHRTNAGSGASALYAEPDNRRQRPGAARRATHATTQLYRSFLRILCWLVFSGLLWLAGMLAGGVLLILVVSAPFTGKYDAD